MDEDRQRELQRRREAARRESRGPRRVLPLVLLAIIVLVAGAAVGAVLGGDDEPQSVPATTAASGTPEGEGEGKPASDASNDAQPATNTTPLAGSADDPRDPAAWSRSGAAARSTKVPILMYHLIAAAPAGTPYPGLWVPPAELKAQVAALAESGFVGVTLGEVWEAWHGDGKLPAHPIVLSFDDGSISQVMEAGPILKDAGWPGVLNLTVDHIGNDGIPSWGVKRLMKQGWDIDSHTLTHPDVTALSGDALKQELAGSRQQIKAKFGVAPKFFCYPAGRNDAASRAAVKAAGYLGATTTEPGIAARADDPFGLPRIRIDPGLSGSAVVKLAKGQSTVAAGSGE